MFSNQRTLASLQNFLETLTWIRTQLEMPVLKSCWKGNLNNMRKCQYFHKILLYYTDGSLLFDVVEWCWLMMNVSLLKFCVFLLAMVVSLKTLWLDFATKSTSKWYQQQTQYNQKISPRLNERHFITHLEYIFRYCKLYSNSIKYTITLKYFFMARIS